MIEDMMKFAVETENYEIAALIRDELNEKRKNV
jgi:protein-arginine kinase activator protein McsA